MEKSVVILIRVKGKVQLESYMSRSSWVGGRASICLLTSQIRGDGSHIKEDISLSVAGEGRRGFVDSAGHSLNDVGDHHVDVVVRI